MTDIFKCERGKTCCSPKAAIKEREQEIKVIERNKLQQQQQFERNQVRRRIGDTSCHLVE